MADAAPFQNPFAPEVLSHPHAFYADLHTGPAAFAIPGTPITYVLGYDAVSEALGRIEDFSNDFGAALAGQRSADPDVTAILATGWPAVDTLLTADPPRHTRFRKLVNLAFSMKRVDAIEGKIRGMAVGLIEKMLEKGEADFVTDFAIPLPVGVITSEIGMDASTDLLTVKRWSDAFADRLGQMIDKPREMECAREVVEFQRHAKIQIGRAHV